MKVWYVYILQNATSDRLYTGISTDPARRLKEHNTSRRGARATRSGRPWVIVYQEKVSTHSEALRRERAVKNLSRVAKLALVSKGTP